MSLTSSSCNETSDEHLSNIVRINTNMSSLAAGNRVLAGLTIPAVLGGGDCPTYQKSTSKQASITMYLLVLEVVRSEGKVLHVEILRTMRLL